MNKKSHKKKHKKRGKGDGGRNKENVFSPGHEDDNECENKEMAAEDHENKKSPCYEVKHSKEMGRYLVASRDIRAGEVIIEEPAIAVGPCSGCNIICLGCYRELDENAIYKCKDCKWPMCSKICSGMGKYTGHSKYECETLKAITPAYNNLEELRESYHALMPLRCLLLKKHDPDKWSALSTMESHNDIRKARGDIWPTNDKNVVQRIVKWGLKYSAEEIHTVCGILEVNAFEVGGGSGTGVGGCGGGARALYPRAHLLAHDCTPSTTHTDLELVPGRPLRVRAALPHKPGDLISLCYAYTLQCTLKRRAHLLHSKFFACSCARCSSRSELGTCAGALRCPRCPQRAMLLPALPLQPESAWRCEADHCGYTMAAEQLHTLLNKLTDEFDAIDANDVQGFERFLYKYRNVLHDTHYLCLSAKHSLSQLYGKVTDYMIHEMPESELKRKIEICRDLMKVFDVIEPGYSRLRGVTLYELHAPLMILTTRDFEKKAISKENLRTRLIEIVGYLTESALILGFEPAQSSEGLMASAAREALKKIKTWEQIIGKIS